MRVAAAVAVLALALAGCGEPEAAGVPRAVLDRLHAEATRRAEDGDPTAPALRRAVEEVQGGAAARGGPSRQTVLAAWMTAAIDAGDVEEARDAHRRLVLENGGEARFADGSTAPRTAVAAGLVAAAAREARRRAEGDGADRAASERALAVADEVRREERVDDPEVLAEVAAARRWTAVESLAALEGAVAAHQGPRVVVLAEDFALGETLLASVLERWAGEGAIGNLRVGVLPLLTGHVRRGARRETATPDEEAGSLAGRFEGKPFRREPGSWRVADAERIGLPPLHAAVLAFDRTGRLAARVSGRTLDPRALDAVVQRLASR